MQDNVTAQFNLGLMYDDGAGVPKSNIDAHMWYNLAASQGDKVAAENRDLLAERMTPEKIAMAHARAREWAVKNRN